MSPDTFKLNALKLFRDFNMTYKFKHHSYDLSSRTFIMGVLNITPDSFSDGGKYYKNKPDIDKILRDAEQMVEDGADFLDIGGESTRPGSDKISDDEELQRVIPVIEKLVNLTDIPLSIDTYKSNVADEALNAGVEIVNDISGFRADEKIAEVTSRYDASCILMHIKGSPKNMQVNPVYEDVTNEVKEYLQDSINIAESNGVKQIFTDVGIGFGKTLEHNLKLLNDLREIRDLGYPVVLGVSRKSFIDKIYPVKIENRLEGTFVANTFGVMNGANVIRVHDVKENKRAMRVIDAIKFNKVYNGSKS